MPRKEHQNYIFGVFGLNRGVFYVDTDALHKELPKERDDLRHVLKSELDYLVRLHDAQCQVVGQRTLYEHEAPTDELVASVYRNMWERQQLSALIERLDTVPYVESVYDEAMHLVNPTDMGGPLCEAFVANEVAAFKRRKSVAALDYDIAKLEAAVEKLTEADYLLRFQLSVNSGTTSGKTLPVGSVDKVVSRRLVVLGQNTDQLEIYNLCIGTRHVLDQVPAERFQDYGAKIEPVPVCAGQAVRIEVTNHGQAARVVSGYLAFAQQDTTHDAAPSR